MVKRLIVKSAMTLIVLLAISAVCYGFTLLSKPKALSAVFWRGARIEKETIKLDRSTLTRVEKRLGGSLVYYQKGSHSGRVKSDKTIEFYFATKNGKRVGVAVIDVQPGKWGPVEFITSMDLKGRVKAVRVMAYQEIRGRPIARRSFMNQFRGKSSRSPLTVGRDIIGVSGATVSSRTACFTVAKAIALYEEVYLK